MPVDGDPHRLQQIVWNLLTNAVKFTPPDGRIEISLRSTDSHAEIQVTDTGVGIPAEFLPYIFDRFRQASEGNSAMRSGLGLAWLSCAISWNYITALLTPRAPAPVKGPFSL